MNDRLLADSLLYAWSASHNEENWITPFLKAIKGVTADEAAFKPRPKVASIWELTAHAVPHAEALAEVLAGNLAQGHEDWPAIEWNPENWKKLMARAQAASKTVTEHLKVIPDAELLGAGKRRKKPLWQSVLDIVVHDAYHAGQVTKIRQIYRAQHLGENDPGTI